jgi:Kef-type K+ transport system membrane component KefB
LGITAPSAKAPNSAWMPSHSVVHAEASLGNLNTLSQVGLLFFMFLVGLEFNPRLMRGRGHAAVVTSHVSIIAIVGDAAATAIAASTMWHHERWPGGIVTASAAGTSTSSPTRPRAGR